MIVYIELESDQLILRLPSPANFPGQIDVQIPVKQGETWNGYTYEQLRELGSGEHKIQID